MLGGNSALYLAAHESHVLRPGDRKQEAKTLDSRSDNYMKLGGQYEDDNWTINCHDHEYRRIIGAGDYD